MTTSEALDQIRSHPVVVYPALPEDLGGRRWEAALAELAREEKGGLVIWTVTDGPQPRQGPKPTNKGMRSPFSTRSLLIPPTTCS